jgi:hypothetical protein
MLPRMWPIIVLLLAAALLFLFGKVLRMQREAAQRHRATGDAPTPPTLTPPAVPIPATAPAAPDLDGYRKRRFLFTPSEFAFFKALRAAVGDQYAILVKIRIADLIEVERYAKGHQAKFNRIAMKHADFVLCHPETMVPHLVIELDDPSHEAEDRQARDAFVDQLYGAVGLPVLHVPTARQYEGAALREAITLATTAAAPGRGA